MAKDDTPIRMPSDDDLTDLAPLDARAQLADRPTTIGPYRLLRPLGEGGMGEVWLAEQKEPIERTVAVKLVKLGMDTKQFIARFESERQALALMEHPFIARVIDGGATETGRPFFVMEYVDGVPITEYCDEHRLTIRERLDLFQRVCEGVQHAHQKGIIHRDLKPSNVMVTEVDGKPLPKIIDFGVAKATSQSLTDKTVKTVLGGWIGTPAYMSPEQAEITDDIDTRTDVYSLGVMLYELLTGLRPFDAETLDSAGFDEMRRVIREVEPPRPSTRALQSSDTTTTAAKTRQTEHRALVKRLRGDLDWIVMKALEKEKERRYGSPTELAADIERHLCYEPVHACPPGTAYRMGRFVRRHRVGVLAAALVAVAVVGGAAAALWQAVRATRAETLALEEAQTATRVSDFLIDIFEVSNPTEARGATITAREILERGAERIEAQLENEPKMRDRLLRTIGDVYVGLGLYQDAAALLEKAMQSQIATLGEENTEVALTMRALATVRGLSGEPDASIPLYERSISILEQDESQSRERLDATVGFGLALWLTGRKARAEAVWEAVLADIEKTLGPDDTLMTAALTNLGNVRREQGRLQEATSLFEHAMRTVQREKGEDHQQIGGLLFSLGEVAAKTGEWTKARQLYEQAFAAWEPIYGSDHPLVALVVVNLAVALLWEGNHEQAWLEFDRVIAVQEATFGSSGPPLADSFILFAEALAGVGHSEEAEELFAKSERLLVSIVEAEDASARVFHRLSDLYEAWGKPEKAAQYGARLDEASTETPSPRPSQ